MERVNHIKQQWMYIESGIPHDICKCPNENVGRLKMQWIQTRSFVPMNNLSLKRNSYYLEIGKKIYQTNVFLPLIGSFENLFDKTSWRFWTAALQSNVTLFLPTDVDECKDSDVCGFRQTCKNTIGGYECPCYIGFSKEKDKEHCLGMEKISSW